MDGSATLVWTAPDAPDAPQSRALSSWALARSLTLTLPPPERPPPLASLGGDHVADEVEVLLERARDAIAARDAEGVDRALSASESMLRAHAELPQAAWLMAEVERCRSTRWSRMPPEDAEAAGRALRRAEGLDGGRTPGIVERESVTRPPKASILIGLAPSPEIQVWLDGRRVGTTVETLVGLHALVVTWAGVPVWAEWIETPPGASSLAVDAPSPAPCSEPDVGRIRITDGAVKARDVRCSRWIAAAPGEQPGEVKVATCEAEGCGPLLAWRAPEAWTWTPPPQHPHDHEKKGWPAVATWGMVGAGAAIVAGAAVILVDVLRPAQQETRFVNGGLKTE
jgi:hypothetical protein